MKYLLVFALSLATAPQAFAQYKCKQPDGATAYQQAPCPNTSAQEPLKVFAAPPDGANSGPRTNFKAQIAEIDRKQAIRDAIASGRPMVGMTAEELNLALGKPDKTNAAQYGVDSRNQLIYYRNGRTLYVYADNGVVSAIQDTEGPATPSRQTRCPSAKEIREIELEKSKIANRDDARLQSELTTRLLDAKACR